MNQVIMAVDTFFFVSWFWVNNSSMRQHGSPFVRDIQQIAMALLALLVFKRVIRCLTGFAMVIFTHEQMSGNIFQSMRRFGIEKVDGILRRWQMTIHTVRHKSMGVVCMGRRSPGIDSKLDFVAGRAKLRGRCPHHGIIRYAENGKSQDHPNSY